MEQLSNTRPSIDRTPWILNILESSEWSLRLHNLPILSKGWSSISKSEVLAQFFCRRLTQERGVFSPSRPPPSVGTWSKMFRELYSLRNMWIPSQQHLLYRVAYEEQAARERFAGLTMGMTMGGVPDEISSSHSSTTTTTLAALTESVAPPPSRYTVGVCVRFRPNKDRPEGETKEDKSRARIAAAKSARFLLLILMDTTNSE